jgi:hypothetical protein
LKGNSQQVSLDIVSSIYRNLRENYELRIRQDEADKFFIKEMELNRKYKPALSKDKILRTKKNSWHAKPSINSTVYSTFVGFEQFGNATHWRKAVERTIADFLPLLSIPSNIQVVLIDYIIKIVGSLMCDLTSKSCLVSYKVFIQLG